MPTRDHFLDIVRNAADAYASSVAKAKANPQCLGDHDLALVLLDVSDQQGWDRLTWTGDPDEYQASYAEDPVPPSSALEFARELLRNYDVVRK